jgi:ferritin
MLISEALAKAMSEQVGREYFAAIQYDMVAAYFEREALPHLTRLFRAQADEELSHARKFIDYVTEAGGVIEIPLIQGAQPTFTGVEEAVQTALDNELAVTKSISSLMDQAIEEGDHIARGLLQWFLDEQLEEVSLQQDLLKVVQRANGDLNYVEQYVASIPAPGAEAGVEARRSA